MNNAKEKSMSNEWDNEDLGNLVELKSGGTPSKQNDEYWEGEIPWVSSKDMKVYRLSDSEDHITEEGLKEGAKLARKGTILLEVRGMALANEIPITIPQTDVAFNQDIKALDCNGKISNEFLFYQILGRENEFKSLVDEAAHGTKRIQTDRLKSFEVLVPPKERQKAIVSVLSAFDDLIENNKRRIEILEEMAEAIYREWFVNFNFPGSEDVEMKDSDLGPIPENFEITKLEEAIELSYGKSLRKDDRNQDGNVPVYGSSGVIDWHDEPLVEGPGIIVGRKGNVGSLFWSEEGFCPIDTTYYVETELPLHYVYYHLQDKKFIDSSTSVPGLSRDQAYKLPFLVPDNPVLEDFQSKIEPIFEIIELLEEKNDTLRETRDLLLPRLISGEIEVNTYD